MFWHGLLLACVLACALLQALLSQAPQCSLLLHLQVGSSNTCQQYLSTSWSVCSLPLGSGSGTVRIQLPSPTAVANFSATPGNITSTANAASLPPVSLPTNSRMSLMVGFSDGSVRDFSSDSRSVYTVTAGAGVCSVVQGKQSDSGAVCGLQMVWILYSSLPDYSVCQHCSSLYATSGVQPVCNSMCICISSAAHS